MNFHFDVTFFNFKAFTIIKQRFMKKSLLLLSTALVIFCISCEKKNEGPGEVYGKWKLTETLADPGDGSGKYKKADGNKILTLTSSGNIEGDALGALKTFKILDSVTMEVKEADQSRAFIYHYKATENTLTLNPPCIEGCGLRFVRN